MSLCLFRYALPLAAFVVDAALLVGSMIFFAPNEVVHFDYLYVGENGQQASQGLSGDGCFRYILVIMDDLSNFASMEPVEVCTAEETAAS